MACHGFLHTRDSGRNPARGALRPHILVAERAVETLLGAVIGILAVVLIRPPAHAPATLDVPVGCHQPCRHQPGGHGPEPVALARMETPAEVPKVMPWLKCDFECIVAGEKGIPAKANRVADLVEDSPLKHNQGSSRVYL